MAGKIYVEPRPVERYVGPENARSRELVGWAVRIRDSETKEKRYYCAVFLPAYRSKAVSISITVSNIITANQAAQRPPFEGLRENRWITLPSRVTSPTEVGEELSV